MTFKGSILGGACHFWGNLYLHSTTVLFDYYVYNDVLLDIEVNFLDNLTKLAFSLLHPTKLVAKKQQENYLTGEMLLERFKVLKCTSIMCLFTV